MEPPGEPKINEKAMLNRGAQKGGPKGENKCLEVYLEWAGAVQTLFATFHENSKYHRKCLCFGSHFGSLLVPFSSLFPKSGQTGPGRRPKVLKVLQIKPKGAQMEPKGTQMEPQGAEMKLQGLPKVPKRLPTAPHVCQNGHPRCHNGSTRPPEVPKTHHKAPQSATKTPIGANKHNWTRTHWVKPQVTKKHIQTARGRVLAAGDVDPAAGRGTTHQAACRRPRSGAGAENRGTSTQGLCS